MIVWDNGKIYGTIGGGELEKSVIERAIETIEGNSKPGIFEFNLVKDLGMCCGGTLRVYRTHCVSEEVPVTVWKNEMHQEEYTYNVTTYRTEPRTRTVRVCHYVNEKASRDVTYTVCHPEQRSRTVNVTTYKTVTEPQTQQFTVMVPRTIQREITVMVCQMVPRTITCQVPVYTGCGYGCGY